MKLTTFCLVFAAALALSGMGHALATPMPSSAVFQAISGVQGAPRGPGAHVPRFQPGDVYGASGIFGVNGSGAVFRLDPNTGAATVLTALDGFASSGNPSLLDYDASLDRLVAWAKLPGISSNNGGFVLLFVEASGAYTYIDLPAQTAPGGLACTGSGRTYINFGATLYYVDGMDPTASQHAVKNAAGTGDYANSLVYGSWPKGWAYDPDLHALVAVYFTSSANCSGDTAAGIHVLRLTSDGTQVLTGLNADTTTVFWDSVPPACDLSYAPFSLSRIPGGIFLTDVRFGGSAFGALFQTFTIDPVTFLPTVPVPFASFTGCPPQVHQIEAAGFSWVDDFVFASCAGHNFTPGGLHRFPLGATGCGNAGPGPYLNGNIRLIAIQP
jgi:hypothetical protein